MYGLEPTLSITEDVIHGVLVQDRYRWLENRSLRSTEAWIRSQQKRCAEYFGHIEILDSVRSRVALYLDRNDVDQPARIGTKYFFRRRDLGQEQASLWVRDRSGERCLVDSSSFEPYVSVGLYRISANGRWLAYEKKRGGDDRSAVHIFNVGTGEESASALESGHKCGLVFHSGNDSFFFCHDIPGTTTGHTVFHRSIGSGSAQPVFQAPRSIGSRLMLIGDDVHLGVVLAHEVGGELVEDLWVARQDRPTEWKRILSNHPLPCEPFFCDRRLFVQLQHGPGDRIVELSLTDGGQRNVLCSEEPLGGVVCGADFFCASHRQSGRWRVRRWTFDGNPLPDLTLTEDGIVRPLPNLGDGRSLFFSHTTLVRPPALLEYLGESERLEVWWDGPDATKGWGCVAEEREFRSRDGAKIPITLLSDRAITRQEQRPTVMTGYGGFGIALIPQYSTLRRILLDLGITLAFPHVRGGGEFGRSWHAAARRERRGIAIEDFVCAARWLVDEGITSPDKLAIMGGSNGGLLVAAAMVQSPQLFRAVLSIGPLLDMVRYEQLASLRRWREEFGSIGNPGEFAALYRYSPYHQVAEDVNYPSVLFVTGERDTRCNPAHVRKMAARLQDRPTQSRPIIVDYHDERGHAPAMPLSARVESLAIRIAFLCRELGIEERWKETQ